MKSRAHVLVFHIDGPLMNMATMRIAAHHRELGDRVEVRRLRELEELTPSAFADIEPRFDDPRWGRVYASILFERSRPLIPRLEALYPGIVIGGTGSYAIGKTLGDVGIGAGPLAYEDYPDATQSIGFAMRGCRFKCDFCVVPRKEGRARAEATIAEIWRGLPHARQILLLDNDFFGNPEWRAVVEALRSGKFKVSIVQGINVRIISDEAAEAMASLNYRAFDMKERRVYTAWDQIGDERVMFRGLARLVKYGIKPDHIMVYMLVGYANGETHASRDDRRKKLRDFGVRPYPMPFVRTPELVGFQRWVVQAFDKRISWDEWKAAHYSPRRLGDRFSLPLFGGR